MSKDYKLLHPRSSQVINGGPKLPTSAQTEIGEIAINFAKDYETLSIINNSGETVPFSSDRKLKKTNINIPYVKTDQTTRSALLSGTCLDLDSLQEGQSIILHLTSGTTSGSTVFPNSCTLDLKLSDGTYTGENIIYYGGTTKLTTHYPGGNDIRLTFHSGLTIGSTTGLTGWWIEGNYDTNTNTLPNQLYYFGNIKSGNPGIQRYSLALMTSAGTWTSITTSSVTGATSSASTVGYLPGSDILYYSYTLAAGGDGSYSYGYISIYSLDFRYSSNCLSTLLNGMPVYLVGTIGADGLFYLDRQTWWTQNLPTTEDGKVYIFLGCAYSNYQLSLWAEHPIYQYKNGHIRLYQEDNTPNVITTEEEYSGLTTSGSLIDAYLFKQINDDNELVISEALREVEFVTAEALNNLKEKTDTLSSTTQNLDERVTDLENSSVDLSSVASAITLNDTVYTVSGGGVDLGTVVSSIVINESAVTISGGVADLGNYIPMTKELTISSSLNDLNDRMILLSANTVNYYTKVEVDSAITSSENSILNTLSSATGDFNVYWANVADSALTFNDIVSMLNHNLSSIMTYVNNTFTRKPVTVWETDGTTGLLGLNNSSISLTTWQLENLDFTPYKYVLCYIKQANVGSTSTAATPSVVVQIPLDAASLSTGYTAYIGGGGGTNPNNRDIHFQVLCAIDTTKTKFQVVSEHSITGTILGARNDADRYCYKIVGYYD